MSANMARITSPRWARREATPPKSDTTPISIAASANWAEPPNARGKQGKEKREREESGLSGSPLSSLSLFSLAGKFGEVFGLGRLAGHAQLVLDVARVGATMRHDGRSVDTQQWHAAIFGVVHTLEDFAQAGPQNGPGYFIGWRPGHLLAHQVPEVLAQPLAKLEDDIAHKAVTDHHVGFPGRDIASLNIANEVQAERGRAFLDELVRLYHLLIAFRLFLSVGKQANTRPPDAENTVHIDRTHEREL